MPEPEFENVPLSLVSYISTVIGEVDETSSKHAQWYKDDGAPLVTVRWSGTVEVFIDMGDCDLANVYPIIGYCSYQHIRYRTSDMLGWCNTVLIKDN